MFEEIYKNAKHTAAEVKDGFLETTIAPAWNAVAWATDKQMHLPVMTIDEKHESVAKIVGEILGTCAEAAIFYKASLLRGAKASALDKDVEVLREAEATSTLGRELKPISESEMLPRITAPTKTAAGGIQTGFGRPEYQFVAPPALTAPIRDHWQGKQFPYTKIWTFHTAPNYWQALSPHGGDEDYLAFVPDSMEEPAFLGNGGSFGCCSVSEHKVPGGTVLIGTHS